MELGLLIFIVTFAICYLFASPKQALGRALGLAIFVAIASVSNQQSYSFMVVATNLLLFPLANSLMAFTSHIPFSPPPEKAFLRLLGRLFHSSEALMANLYQTPQQAHTGVARWMEKYHAREVATLPRKLGAWAKFINPKFLPGTSPQQVQALIISLQGLSNRIQELLEERNTPQASLLIEELRNDVQDWHLKVQGTFQSLANAPEVDRPERFQDSLTEILERLEQRIRRVVDKANEGELSEQDGVNFYRLLGAFRGVSEAVIGYAGSAAVINWKPWREERF